MRLQHNLWHIKIPAKKIYQVFAIIIVLTVMATGFAPLLSDGPMFYFNWKATAVDAALGPLQRSFFSR